MLHSFADLTDFTIRAQDGEIGSVRDLFFDDRSTRIRYIVVDTGRWLPGRRVLLAPSSIGPIDRQDKALTTALTRQQVEDSPGIESDRPVSRQEELRLHQHFGWDPYWMHPPEAGLAAPFWGGTYAPPVDAGPGAEAAPAADEDADLNLRSAREVRGYSVAARDGEVGTVDDYLIDDQRWTVSYLVVDTGGWLSSRPVLVRPDWLRAIEWADRKVTVDLDREQIRTSPPYDRSITVDEAHERRLAEHYGRSA